MKCEICSKNEAQLTLVDLYHDGSPLEFRGVCWDCANDKCEQRKFRSSEFRGIDTSLSFIWGIDTTDYVKAVDLYYQELWS